MSKTTPTKDSIRAEFEELVEKDSFWSKFVGSQFVSMLTLFITQIVYRCFQYADAALAEGFISTATRRSSILAAAETNSYVGTKPTPSSGMIEITATSEDAPAVSQSESCSRRADSIVGNSNQGGRHHRENHTCNSGCRKRRL